MKFPNHFVLALTAALALLLASCGITNSSSGGSTSTGTAAGDLTAIPDYRADAPDSLGGSDMKMKMKSPMRVLGDVSVFSTDTLSDMRSGGWKMMYDILNRQNGMENLIIAIREYASNNTVYFNTPVTINFPAPGGTNTIAAKFVVAQADSNVTEVYISLVRPVYSGATFVFDRREYIFLTLRKNEDGKYASRMMVRFEPLSTNTNSAEYIRDANTEIFAKKDFSFGVSVDFVKSPTVMHLNRSFYDTETNIIVFSMLNDPAGIVRTVGIGNAARGGLISRVSNNLRDNIYTEYYKTNGAFIYKSYGETTTDLFGWMSDMTNGGINLADVGFTPGTLPPQLLVFEGGWDFIVLSGIYTNWILIIGPGMTSNYYNITNGKVDIYLKQNPGTPAWQTGDCVLWRSNMIEGAIGPGGVNTNFFRIGLKVPSPSAYFGQNYYMNHVWAIKYLEPSSLFAPAKLTRRVINEATNVSVTTNSYLGLVLTNSYVLQDYEWWMDKENNSNFNPRFDVKLRNINQEKFFFFDFATRMPFEQMNYVVRNTDPFPNYFQFKPGENAIVAELSNRLVSTYQNEMVNFSFSNFYTNLPAFPDKSKFPVP